MVLKFNKFVDKLSQDGEIRLKPLQLLYSYTLPLRTFQGIILLLVAVVTVIGMGIPGVQANPVAIPVHALPYACKDNGFPLLLDYGILGCTKDGEAGLWMDMQTRQTKELSKGNWAKGETLFRDGVDSGLWDSSSESWKNPSRRIVESIYEGQLYATSVVVLWSDDSNVHRLDIETGQVRQIEANVLQGVHPVSFGEYVAWLEWGTEMGVHVWHPLEGTHIWIPSKYPSSLIDHQSQLVWLTDGEIMVWSFDTKMTERPERKVKEVFSTERGLCWTEWVNDMDILCE